MSQSSQISKQNIISPRINLDGDKLQLGLAKLVLTLVEVLRQVLEKEALRRVESGSLSAEEVDRLGVAFMQIKERMYELSYEFGFDHKDLEVNLGSILGQGEESLGNFSLVEVIDRLLNKGVSVSGKVTISVADVDLIVLNLLAVLSGITNLQGNSSDKVVNRVG